MTQAFASLVTVTGTTYPALPQVANTAFNAGSWTIHNDSANKYVYVSFDGATDAAIIPPGVSWNSDASTFGQRVWMHLDSTGSAKVTLQSTSREAHTGG